MSSIYVNNLPQSITEEMLKSKFDTYGTIKSVRIPKKGNRSPSFGFVDFEESEAAQKVIDENKDVEIDGSAIKVEITKSQGHPPRSGSRDEKRYSRSYRRPSPPPRRHRRYSDDYDYDDDYRRSRRHYSSRRRRDDSDSDYDYDYRRRRSSRRDRSPPRRREPYYRRRSQSSSDYSRSPSPQKRRNSDSD